MATITKDVYVYFNPKCARTEWEYSFCSFELIEDDEWVFVAKTSITFDDNTNKNEKQIEFLEKQLKTIQAEFSVKSESIKQKINELKAIGYDSNANSDADKYDEVQF